MHFVHNYM